jgi:two-component system, LytTR family, response regulator
MDTFKTIQGNCLQLKVADGIQFIPYDDIVRIEFNKKKIMIFTNSNDKPIEGYGKMKDIEKQLSDSDFYCCHRSHIINLRYLVKYLSKSSDLLTTRGIAPLSERKVNLFKNTIMNKI